MVPDASQKKNSKRPPWIKTQYVGVRYREHRSRKHNGKKDRYFVIRYKKEGKLASEGTGWSSEGMNAQQSNFLRTELVRNIREGKRPQSLAEKRELEEARQRTASMEKERERREKITFDELAQEFLKWARSNKKDYFNDHSRYENHIKPALGGLPAKDITPFLLEKLKRDLQKKRIQRIKAKKGSKGPTLSPKTIHHCLTLIRTIYHKAGLWGLYSGQIPTAKVKFPKLDNKRVRFFSHEEADILLEKLQGKSQQVHDQAIIALHCGLRFSEISKLRWADIDLESEVIQILDPKGESRPAYITDQAKEIFERLQQIQPCKPVDRVFQTKTGARQKHVSSSFYRVVADCGFNDGITDRRQRVCFHTLRHSFASWLALQGTSLYEIMELLGQKDIRMAQRYSHLLPNVKKQAVKDMAAAFQKRKKRKKKATEKKN